MWKLFFTFVCGIIVVSSLSVSSQENGQVLPKKVDWDTLFPLVEINENNYEAFVLNITTLMFAIEDGVVNYTHELFADSEKAVDNYMNITYGLVHGFEKEMLRYFHTTLDPIKVLRPSSNQCWRVYHALTDAGTVMIAAIANCSLEYLNSMDSNLTAISQALRQKNFEISKPSEPLRPCEAEGCQKEAKQAILLAKNAVEEFFVGWNTIRARALRPEIELNKCEGPAVDDYFLKNDAVYLNVQSCVDKVSIDFE